MATMSTTRRTAFVVGVFLPATELTSNPALLPYQPVLRDGSYIPASDADNQVLLGGLLELLPVSGRFHWALSARSVRLKRRRTAVVLAGAVIAR
jgi:hypothetical protein